MTEPIKKSDLLPVGVVLEPPPSAPKVYVAQKQNGGKEVTVTPCLPEVASPSTFVNGPDRQLQTYVCKDGRRYTQIFLENKRDKAANDWRVWQYKFDDYGGWHSLRSQRDRGILVYPIKSPGWSGEAFETDLEIGEILIQKNLLSPGKPPKKTSISRLTLEAKDQWLQKKCAISKEPDIFWGQSQEGEATDIIGYGAQYLCDSEQSLGANVWLLRPIRVFPSKNQTEYKMGPWVWRAMDEEGILRDRTTDVHWYQNERLETLPKEDSKPWLDFLVNQNYFSPPPNYWITSPNGEDHTFSIHPCRLEKRQYFSQRSSEIASGSCIFKEGKSVPFSLARNFSVQTESPDLSRYVANTWSRFAYFPDEKKSGPAIGNSVVTPARNVLILMDEDGNILRDISPNDPAERDRAIREAYEVPDDYDVRFLSFSLGVGNRTFEESPQLGSLGNFTVTAHPLAFLGSPLAGLTAIGSLEVGRVTLGEEKYQVGTGKLGVGIRLRETLGWDFPIDLSGHFYLFERGYHDFLQDWYQSYFSQGGGCLSYLWKYGSLDFCYDYQRLSMERARETPAGRVTERLGNASIFSVRGSFDLGTEIETLTVLKEE